ncbi:MULTISPECIES: transposase [unclassified Chryseobacterium]|uniref:transposase n=1 Tax=unclassified Chryseobacterium TaxID=2593645 RepID=UPI000F45B1A3|nr:transposase [Chryseobacterium sp. G0240]ROI05062.1 transposase [Chryseobacterium sp. G0240]
MNLKEIHIGQLIQVRVEEREMEIFRLCNYFKCTEYELNKVYESQDISTALLLKWCKLLEYDFFRLYSQHLILYSPPAINKIPKDSDQKTSLPQFRKNIYTSEMIEFILEMVKTGAKTKQQIITEYRIPKTTLYKWIEKYSSKENL